MVLYSLQIKIYLAQNVLNGHSFWSHKHPNEGGLKDEAKGFSRVGIDGWDEGSEIDKKVGKGKDE